MALPDIDVWNRVPSLPTSKTTIGTFDVNRIDTLANLKGTVTAVKVASLPTSKITSGSFNANRIPILPTTRITSGTFGLTRIPSIDNAHLAGDITSDKISALSGTAVTYPLNADTVGTTAIKSAGVGNAELAASGLDISKCTIGTAGVARIPSLPTARITSGTFNANRIPTLGRGAYTAIVYKEGSMYIAEEDNGNLIIENSDASTVIQKAIDDYAQDGLVVITPNVTLTSTLKILKARSNVEFVGTITSTGVDAIEFGDSTHFAGESTLKLTTLTGINESAHGIVLRHVGDTRIFFGMIKKCNIGLYFNPCTGGRANENFILGGTLMDFSTAAIRFSSAALTMEGNHFQTNIFNAPIGFDLVSGGNSKYQTYIGVIDCVNDPGSQDIKDAVGRQFFMCDFVRRQTCTIGKDTLLINVLGVGSDVLEMRTGSVDMLNVGFTPFLMWDFNRDSTADWSKTQCTMGTPSKSAVRLTATGIDPSICRAISIDGGQAPVIIIRYKYISGTGIAGATILYTTSGHGYTNSYRKAIDAVIIDGEWHVVALDMTYLTEGGSDWVDSIITAIRYDFVDGTSDAVFDIDYIAIGTRGYGTIYNIDDALKTPASAGAVGNKGDTRWDAGYIYICTAKDTWKRVAIATW